MLSLKALLLSLTLLTTTLSNPLEPSLEHRQLGSCATAPCATGLCCSQWQYCGTGPDYCQIGSCNGGVGGTCAPGLCCSKYGYCGTGPDFCPLPPTSSSSIISSTSSSSSSVSPSPTGVLVPQWGQCGGQDYTGPTLCARPYVCTFYSVWWSDCR